MFDVKVLKVELIHHIPKPRKAIGAFGVVALIWGVAPKCGELLFQAVIESFGRCSPDAWGKAGLLLKCGLCEEALESWGFSGREDAWSPLGIMVGIGEPK